MAAEQFDPCLAANVFKDPHLSFAYGGTADFRGRHNALYNFLSTPRLSVNVRTGAGGGRGWRASAGHRRAAGNAPRTTLE